ncbi:MAG TPA: lysozyme inhibitor LprI family protein [Leptolyngbyaceae cyanobacterium]
MSKFLLATVATLTLFNLATPTPTIGGTKTDVASITITVAQRPNCNNPMTQAEMNACAGIAYQNADRKLNQVYQQLLPKLSTSRKQKLITAQRAWIRFRDSSCDFERSEVAGGSMEPMMYSNCMASVTEERIQDLERYLELADR